MTSMFRMGAVLGAIVALFVAPGSALAQGGGGGGTCAQILSFTNTPSLLDDGTPVITTAYTVKQGCVDERAASVSLIFHNDNTGFTGTEVNMTPLGTWSYSRTWNSGFGTRYTITLNVYSPNGKLQATQKQTVTAPAAL